MLPHPERRTRKQRKGRTKEGHARILGGRGNLSGALWAACLRKGIGLGYSNRAKGQSKLREGAGKSGRMEELKDGRRGFR